MVQHDRNSKEAPRRQKQTQTMPEEQFNNYSPHSMWKGIKTTQQSLSDNNRPDALNQYFSHFDTGEGGGGNKLTPVCNPPAGDHDSST